MSSEKATELFSKHDTYVKSLRYLMLSPMINNLDTLRVEHFPDGSMVERSTRDWAATILTSDGTGPAHCDVVNGGYDQQSYLLMAPQHETTAIEAFAEYCRRVFPFTQRESRFRDSIGPPPSVIHVDAKVSANLSFIDQLFTTTETWKQSDQSTTAEADSLNWKNASLDNKRTSTEKTRSPRNA